MMKKELKISELASIWGVSVPTAWNRIRKEGLTTFKKKDENNKEVNFVEVPEEFLKENIKNGYKDVKNGYYEDLLKDNNLNDDVIDAEYTRQGNQYGQSQAADFFNGLINLNNDYNDRLTKVYNDYNNHLKEVHAELIEYKSKMPLLELHVHREGAYLKEINDLKEANNKAIKQGEFLKNWLITVIILMILGLSTLTVLLILAIKKPPEIRTVEVEKIIEKPVIKYVRR